MRKCDKIKPNCYINDGSWHTKNVRYRFYQLLFESMKICDYTYNDKLKKCRNNRTVYINSCLRMPLNTLLYQLRDNKQSSYISLGYRIYLDMVDITSIALY